MLLQTLRLHFVEWQIVDLDLAGTHIDANHLLPQSQIIHGLVDMFLFQDIVHGVDAMGSRKSIKIDMVYVTARFPGVEPLLALKQIATANPNITQPLLNTLSHMKTVFGFSDTSSASLNEMFSSGSGSGASCTVCDLCCEALMPWAIFEFANTQKILDINFGGFRADVNNETDKKLWQRYKEGVITARRQHYNIIAAAVNQDLQQGTSSAAKADPFRGFGLDYYDGMYYRKVSLKLLDEEIEAHVAKLRSAGRDDANAVHLNLAAWRERLLQDKEFAYVSDGRPWARNTGVWLRVNMSAFLAFERVRKRVSANTVERDNSLLQPMKVSSYVNIYMSNRSAVRDSLQLLWCDNIGQAQTTPYVLDFNYMRSNQCKIPEPLMVLLDAMHEEVTTSSRPNISEANLLHEELLQLYGCAATRHRIISVIDRTLRESPLTEMCNIVHTSLEGAIKSTLVAMRTGQLKHWQMAAGSLIDLNVQANDNASVWYHDYRAFARFLQEVSDAGSTGEGNSSTLLDDTAISGIYFARMEKHLDLDLSFCNRVLLDMLTRNAFAHFSYQPKIWGTTIKVADMAHSVEIIHKSKFGNMYNYDKAVVDWKYPGAGVDSLLNTFGECNNTYGRYLVTDPDVRKFYNSSLSVDVIAKQISPLSMAQWLGSGLAMTADNVIDEGGSGFRDLAGVLGHLTEIGKLKASSNDSDDQLANIECFINESGQGSGTRKEPWSTTRGLQALSWQQMLGFPLGLCCSNRRQKAFTRSIFEGGRMQSVASSVRDGEVGALQVCNEVWVGDSADHAPDATDDGQADTDQSSDNNSNANAAQSRHTSMQQTFDFLLQLQKEDRTPMRPVSEEMALANRRYFLLRHLWRKALPFTLRSMTVSYCKCAYTFRMSIRVLGAGMRAITENLRRHYLAEETVITRTADGPWETSGAYPMFVLQITEAVSARVMRNAWQNSSGSGHVHVPLNRILSETVAALMSVPLTFSAMFSSLHSFLFATVLDISVMILSCHVMLLFAMSQSCPLVVLALVARGHPLSSWQQARYEYLCARLLPVVAKCDAEQEGFMLNVPAGFLDIPSMDDLYVLYGWEDPATHRSIGNLYLHRRQNTEVSTFIRPRVKFETLQTPDWRVRRAMSQAGRNVREVGEDYATTTPLRIIASTYASQQTESAHCERTRRGFQPREFEVPHRFWKAAHAGTRLPQSDGKNTDTKHELMFDPAHQTGYWYLETIRNLGSCKGLTRAFLAMCGLDDKTTYTQLMTTLLRPYLEKTGISCEVHRNSHWSKPILSDDTECFAWCNASSINEQMQIPVGYETTLCMNVVFFLLAQAMYLQEWAPTSEDAAAAQHNVASKFRASVHLRTMAQANLEIMCVLLHTQVEKAVVPANDGKLILTHPTPFLEKFGQCAVVHFDPRVHVDSNYQHMLPVTNMLSLRDRRPNMWTIFTLEDKSRVLWYSSCIKNKPTSVTPDNTGELFPFPPESVYHMQAHYNTMSVVNARYVKQNIEELRQVGGDSDSKAAYALRWGESHCLVDAMQTYGNSVTWEAVAHIPSVLTYCVTRCDMEIPCITYKYGFIFVLRFRGTDIQVVPVLPCATTATTGFCALPLISRRPYTNKVPLYRLADAMAHGLRIIETSDGADDQTCVITGVALELGDCTLHTPAPLNQHEAVPFYLFPVIKWPQLLVLDVSRNTVVFTQGGESCLGILMPLMEWMQSLHDQKLVWSAVDTEEFLEEELTKLLVHNDRHLLIFVRNVVKRGVVLYGSTLRPGVLLTRCIKGKSMTRTFSSVWHMLHVLHHLFDECNSQLYPAMAKLDTALFTKEIIACLSQDVPHVVVADTVAVGFGEFEHASTAQQGHLVLQDDLGFYFERHHFCNVLPELEEKKKELQQTLASAKQQLQSIEGAGTTNLSLQVAQRVTLKVQQDLDELDSQLQCPVRATEALSDRLRLSNGLDMFPLATPASKSTTADRLTLGLIQQHTSDNSDKKADFLLNGQYCVQFLAPNAQQRTALMETNMDFISTSRCHVREGSTLLLRLDATITEQLLSLNLTLPVCKDLGGDEAHDDKSPAPTHRFLQVYYVLGGTSHDTSIDMATITVMALIGEGVQADGHGPRRLPVERLTQQMLRVRLYNDNGDAVILPDNQFYQVATEFGAQTLVQKKGVYEYLLVTSTKNSLIECDNASALVSIS